MDDIVDLLQIKIEKAKAQLPENTLNAISAIDWKATILGLRVKKGYSFEQLGDLELETELLLCGLLNGEKYQKELEDRMKIPRTEARELVEEMNKQVFSKIREELIKNTERKKIFERGRKNDDQVLDKAGIKIVPARNAYSIAYAGGEPALSLDINKEKTIENREDILKKIEKPELILPKFASIPTTAPQGEQSKEEVPARIATQSVAGGHPMLANKLSGSFQIPTIKTEYSLNNITKTNISSVKTNIPSMDPYRELPE